MSKTFLSNSFTFIVPQRSCKFFHNKIHKKRRNNSAQTFGQQNSYKNASQMQISPKCNNVVKHFIEECKNYRKEQSNKQGVISYHTAKKSGYGKSQSHHQNQIKTYASSDNQIKNKSCTSAQNKPFIFFAITTNNQSIKQKKILQLFIHKSLL